MTRVERDGPGGRAAHSPRDGPSIGLLLAREACLNNFRKRIKTKLYRKGQTQAQVPGIRSNLTRREGKRKPAGDKTSHRPTRPSSNGNPAKLPAPRASWSPISFTVATTG